MTAVPDNLVLGWTQRETTILAMVTARCWRDATYRARVNADPRQVLADEGLQLPETYDLRVVESMTQIDAQAHASVRYVVLPPAPAGTDPSTRSEAELVREAVTARPKILTPQGWVFSFEEEATATTTTTTAEAEAEIVIVAT